MFREFLPRKFASNFFLPPVRDSDRHDREHVGDRKVP